MDGGTSVSIELVNGVAEVDASLWDACAAPEAQNGDRAVNPFLTHRWLNAFEESGSAHWREGWDPKHLIASGEMGQTLGVMPLYVKGHSQGEYVFDHGWAQAFERAGGDYYPKLLSATPIRSYCRRLRSHL